MDETNHNDQEGAWEHERQQETLLRIEAINAICATLVKGGNEIHPPTKIGTAPWEQNYLEFRDGRPTGYVNELGIAGIDSKTSSKNIWKSLAIFFIENGLKVYEGEMGTLIVDSVATIKESEQSEKTDEAKHAILIIRSSNTISNLNDVSSKLRDGPSLFEYAWKDGKILSRLSDIGQYVIKSRGIVHADTVHNSVASNALALVGGFEHGTGLVSEEMMGTLVNLEKDGVHELRPFTTTREQLIESLRKGSGPDTAL